MESGLPVRLHLLIPVAENAVGAHAFRPGDVLIARDGTSVEITNTDAEGRLLLADALVRAGEEKPELIVDFATLTGAARVALGPDLPALFANDDALATALAEGGAASDDPLWRLPLWSAYEETMKSDIADIVNSAEGGFGGAITAALFLQRFVPKDIAWAHLDTFAWRPAAKPGRPKGGDALGLRAVAAALRARYDRSGANG
jgi:leucyl aminopeptidase